MSNGIARFCIGNARRNSIPCRHNQTFDCCWNCCQIRTREIRGREELPTGSAWSSAARRLLPEQPKCFLTNARPIWICKAQEMFNQIFNAFPTPPQFSFPIEAVRFVNRGRESWSPVKSGHYRHQRKLASVDLAAQNAHISGRNCMTCIRSLLGRLARTARLTLRLVCLLWFCLGAFQATAAEAAPDLSPAEFQAVFLSKFLAYVSWPNDALPAQDQPITVGLFGYDPFGGLLQSSSRTRNRTAARLW